MDNYEDKITEEIKRYGNMEIVHDLPSIFHYWSNIYLKQKMESLGFSHINQIYVSYIKKAQNNNKCEILSIGAGNCDIEIAIAQLLLKEGINNFIFYCLDLNKEMLSRGQQQVHELKLTDNFSFIIADINKWTPNKTYDVVMANHSLHHFVNLEDLFHNIYNSLSPKGYFITHDMIGRNGHMRWPEALAYVNHLWGLLPEKYKYNNVTKKIEHSFINRDYSLNNFEGIRSQDILPLLINKFNFELFLGFTNIISIFVDRLFGGNFDKTNKFDTEVIDFISMLDDYYIESGIIKPTQMVAVMVKEQVESPKIYKHLTPEFCVRIP